MYVTCGFTKMTPCSQLRVSFAADYVQLRESALYTGRDGHEWVHSRDKQAVNFAPDSTHGKIIVIGGGGGGGGLGAWGPVAGRTHLGACPSGSRGGGGHRDCRVNSFVAGQCQRASGSASERLPGASIRNEGERDVVAAVEDGDEGGGMCGEWQRFYCMPDTSTSGQ
jgi:hypothetical protein